MHFRVIVPIVRGKRDWSTEVQAIARPILLPGATVDTVHIDTGPESIENAYDEVQALPGTLRCVEAAIEDKVDGMFISCFGDPGVQAARELSRAPIVGGFEPAVLAAASVADHFAIVTIMASVRPLIRRLLLGSQLAGRCVAVRTVDLPVLELADSERLSKALLAQSLIAVQEEGAEAIVLGCTGMIGVADWLQRELEDRIGAHVPVVDPNAAALTSLQSLALMGRRHSEVTYIPSTTNQKRK